MKADTNLGGGAGRVAVWLGCLAVAGIATGILLNPRGCDRVSTSVRSGEDDSSSVTLEDGGTGTPSSNAVSRSAPSVQGDGRTNETVPSTPGAAGGGRHGRGTGVVAVTSAGTAQGRAAVSGRVRRPDEEGVVGIRVEVRPLSFDRDAIMAAVDQAAVAADVTDGEGRYRVRGLAAGGYLVYVNLPLKSEYVAPKPHAVVLRDGQEATACDFVLQSGDVIYGWVVDQAKQPIAGALLSARHEELRLGDATTRTDAKGFYEIGGIAPGAAVARLHASKEGYSAAVKTELASYHGPQNFVLVKGLGFVLVTLDGESSEPVRHYIYQILNTTWHGRGVEPRHERVAVYAPEGRKPITGLFNYREIDIRVKETDAAGKLTGRIGAAHVRIDPARDREQEVVVRVGEGGTIRGTVVYEDGRPAPGIAVQFEPLRTPAAGLVRGQVVESTVTDERGAFVLPHVFPGKHRLVVSADGATPEDPVMVTVPENGDPPPVRVVLVAGGRVYGRITGLDGAPAVGLSVHYAEYIEWYTPARSCATDTSGDFEFRGVSPGHHRVFFEDTQGDISGDEFFQLQAGEDKKLNFDFSGDVLLTGHVLSNGRLWEGTPSLALRGVEGIQPYHRVKRSEEGTYELRVKPGVYDLVAGAFPYNYHGDATYANSAPGGIVERLRIDEQPREQTLNLDLTFAEGAYLIHAPADEAFRRGVIKFTQRFLGMEFKDVFKIEITKMGDPIWHLVPGQFKAEYWSRDGGWKGESEWLAVTAGGENLFDIRLDDGTPVKIGGWETHMVSELFAPLDCDATAAVSGVSDYDVALFYDKGACMLMIEWVSLLENGREIARDTHPGMTGVRQYDNIYRFRNIRRLPGARYTVRYSGRLSGSGDSFGSVYLSRRGVGGE